MSSLPRIRICKPILGRIPFTTDRGNRASLSKLLIPKTFGSLRAQFCGAKNQRQYLRTRQTLSCSMPSKRGIVHPQRSAKPKSTDETRRLTDIDEPGEESLVNQNFLQAGPDLPATRATSVKQSPLRPYFPRCASLANAMHSQDSLGSRRCPRRLRIAGAKRLRDDGSFFNLGSTRV